MKARFVLEVEYDPEDSDLYDADGEPLEGEELIGQLTELLLDGALGIGADEIKSVELMTDEVPAEQQTIRESNIGTLAWDTNASD